MRKIGFAVFFSHVISGLVGRSFTYAIFTNRPAAEEYMEYMNNTNHGNYTV